MQEKEFYTVKELGSILDMPESTVRYFRDRFIDFIPFEGKGRSRKYTQESIEVIRAIVEYNNAKMNAEEIEKALSTRFTRVIDITQERREQKAEQSKSQRREFEEVSAAAEPGLQITNQEVMAAIQQVQMSMVGLSQSIAMMMDQQKELEGFKKMIEEMELRSAKREKDLLERIRALEDQVKKPWWKFWGK